ncbi:oxidation resistance protein 1 [Tilletia horrida]|nr:oxidation resistance protein 1 [Tilletia horrida]
MSVPRYSPSTGRFERPVQPTRTDSDDSDFGAFVDAESDTHSHQASSSTAYHVGAVSSPAALATPTQADEDLFHAFERAAIEQAERRPSPPPIDLRGVENKLGADILVPKRMPSYGSSGQTIRLEDSTSSLSPSSTPFDSASFFDAMSASDSQYHDAAQDILRRGSGSNSGASPSRSPQDSLNLSSDHSHSHRRQAARTLSPRKPIAVTLTDRQDITSEVIMPWHASHLQAALPPRLRLGKTWKLLYSIDQHGTSLGTLYNNVARGLDPSRVKPPPTTEFSSIGDSYMRGASSAARGAVGLSSSSGRKLGAGLSLSEAGLILAVRDEEDNIFGAFINERLRPHTGYYGTGETFLWKTTRQPAPVLARDPSAEPNRIKTFRWTGRNDYVLLTETSFLSIGGGESGRYGLWLDSGLENGVSSRCSTFANDVLCDDEPGGEEQDGGGDLAMEQERQRADSDPFGLMDDDRERDAEEAKFEVIGLEVWAVGID